MLKTIQRKLMNVILFSFDLIYELFYCLKELPTRYICLCSAPSFWPLAAIAFKWWSCIDIKCPTKQLCESICKVKNCKIKLLDALKLLLMEESQI